MLFFDFHLKVLYCLLAFLGKGQSVGKFRFSVRVFLRLLLDCARIFCVLLGGFALPGAISSSAARQCSLAPSTPRPHSCDPEHACFRHILCPSLHEGNFDLPMPQNVGLEFLCRNLIRIKAAHEIACFNRRSLSPGTNLLIKTNQRQVQTTHITEISKCRKHLFSRHKPLGDTGLEPVTPSLSS